jgi:arsenate reductase-like glutaredoxin family protein
MVDSCIFCGEDGTDLYGYDICDSCKKKLKLIKDETIQKHIAMYDQKDHSYHDEIQNRLDLLEKDHIQKKIKLLHIQDRLKYL